jgi:hypothetical protein
LCLDSRPHCLRHHRGCRWEQICRRPRSACYGGTGFQFRGDNCRFYINMGCLQLGLHCILPPPCIQVSQIRQCGHHRRLTLDSISWQIFAYSYLGLNIPLVRDASARLMTPLTIYRLLLSAWALRQRYLRARFLPGIQALLTGTSVDLSMRYYHPLANLASSWLCCSA